MTLPDAPKLELVKYRVIGKTYAKWRAIFTEVAGNDDTLFRGTLWQGFGIRIPADQQETMLYIIEDTAQRRELQESGIINPTLAQLLLSTKVVALSEKDAIDKMQAWIEANRVKVE